MSKRSPELETETDQILTERTNTQELLESVEENIEDTTDEEYHYSLDIIHSDNNSIRIGVYGVEGYDLPSQRTVANAVAEQFDWITDFKEGVSTEDCYHMRIQDRENDSKSF